MMFLDFEASSLVSDSWPVEIGLAWVTDGDVHARSRLIRPDPRWPRGSWSAESAAVHGIAPEALEMAPPAAEVARWAAGVIGAGPVVSDAPEWDGFWLRRLYEAADGLDAPPVGDFDHLVARTYEHDQLLRVYAALDALPAPHRAGPDAARLAAAWLAGREE